MSDEPADNAPADEDRLPWLEAVEDEDEGGPSALKLIVAVVIGLVAIGGCVDIKAEVDAMPGLGLAADAIALGRQCQRQTPKRPQRLWHLTSSPPRLTVRALQRPLATKPITDQTWPRLSTAQPGHCPLLSILSQSCASTWLTQARCTWLHSSACYVG